MALRGKIFYAFLCPFVFGLRFSSCALLGLSNLPRESTCLEAVALVLHYLPPLLADQPEAQGDSQLVLIGCQLGHQSDAGQPDISGQQLD